MNTSGSFNHTKKQTESNKMSSPPLSLNALSASALNTKPSKADPKIQSFSPSRAKPRDRIVRCRASASPAISGYDLYEILGIDSSSDQSQIKQAYRALQKRCHPDIAGPAGHDMAIILNEVYSLLSDPASRSAYDQEQAKVSEFQGYTGKPLYSAWFGSETEQRAVFVDELKCVGCLKCALFANKTFAIESVYGRARVVAQWADPEDKILDAIQICPVDCISMVERSNLAALEFLMSRQPRGSVRLTAGNTGGVRVSNIFADVDKFLNRLNEMRTKASTEESQDSRASAVHGIRSISNWWYWQGPTRQTTLSLMKLTTRKATRVNAKRLQEAAANLRARAAGEPIARTFTSYNHNDDEEYWSPTLVLPSPSNISQISEAEPLPNSGGTEARSRTAVTDDRMGNPTAVMVPAMMAVISALVVGSSEGGTTGGGLGEHIAGTAALDAVNSHGLQVLLAGATWFVIGTAVHGFLETLGITKVFKR